MLSPLAVLFIASGVVGIGLLVVGFRWRPRVTRDTALFVVGLLGVVHETVVTKGARPALLVTFGGMMALPSPLHRDREKRSADS